MGGQSSSTTNQSQNQSGNTSSISDVFGTNGQVQSSSTNPWTASMPTIQGLIAQLNPLIANSGANANQTAGLNQLVANAQGGNPFAGGISSYANDMLAGGGATNQAGRVTSAYDQLNSRLSAQADPNYSSLNDPKLRAALDQIQSDVGNSVNGQFAAAGRDMSGANQMAYGRGVSAAQTPLILDQFNKDRANQMSAANTLYGAGNTTSGLLSAMQQQAQTNRGQGVTAAGSALDAQNWGANQLLNAGTQQGNIPIQKLGLLAQIGLPIAGLGQTSTGSSASSSNKTANTFGTSNMSSNGTSTTQNNPSLLSQLQGWTNLLSSWI